MSNLFGILNMGARSLDTQRAGIEVAGHNLANANNPAYSRQRVRIETTPALSVAGQGIFGTGSMAAGVDRIRDLLLDTEISSQTSLSGSLDAQQSALEQAQSELGQSIDRQASGAEGSAASELTGSQHGLNETLSAFFSSLNQLTNRAADLNQRNQVLANAGSLAEKFNQTSARLENLSSTLDQSLGADVTTANNLLQSIAQLNAQIQRTEGGNDGMANDLRDTRQGRLEELAKLVKFTATETNGEMNLTIGGQTLITGSTLNDTLATYTAADGALRIQTETGAQPLDITSGSIEGRMTVRDGELKTMRGQLDKLASNFITEINAIHASGYGLEGTTGAAFFSGTGAKDIAVNDTLVGNPALLQASDAIGAGGRAVAGNGKVISAMLASSRQNIAGLDNQTFSQSYGRLVSDLGTSLNTVNHSVTDQGVVTNMLSRQRDAISGVSLDEEMTDLIKYQKAFAASAKIITAVDEMLDTVISMKR